MDTEITLDDIVAILGLLRDTCEVESYTDLGKGKQLVVADVVNEAIHRLQVADEAAHETAEN